MTFAILDPKQVEAFAMNCLTVVGAFIAGYVIGAIGSWAIDKWLFAKRSPHVAKKAISILTGLVIAAIVAFLVFGGGSGFGTGGGSGTDGTGSTDSQDGQSPDSSPARPVDPKVQPKIDPKDSDYHKPGDPEVHITFLGGDAVQGDRFYLVDDDAIPKSFAELKTILLKKKEAAAGPLTLIVRYPMDPRQRIDPNSINVAQVTSWAEGQGIGVFRPAKK
jgi:hypothetical protein